MAQQKVVWLRNRSLYVDGLLLVLERANINGDITIDDKSYRLKKASWSDPSVLTRHAKSLHQDHCVDVHGQAFDMSLSENFSSFLNTFEA